MMACSTIRLNEEELMDRDVQDRKVETQSPSVRETYASPKLEIYGYVWEIATLGTVSGADGQSKQA